MIPPNKVTAGEANLKSHSSRNWELMSSDCASIVFLLITFLGDGGTRQSAIEPIFVFRNGGFSPLEEPPIYHSCGSHWLNCSLSVASDNVRKLGCNDEKFSPHRKSKSMSSGEFIRIRGLGEERGKTYRSLWKMFIYLFIVFYIGASVIPHLLNIYQIMFCLLRCSK